METFENIIIGFGKGGKTLAKQLAQQGEQVLLIEKSAQMYGGTCINIGCIPSKSLITQAEQHQYFNTAMVRKNKLVDKLRQKNFQMIDNESQAQVWTASAQFINNYTLKLTFPDNSTRDIRGKRIFINTGATSVIPNIEGATLSSRIMTSTSALSQQIQPRTLTIIGGGYIGLEFASMYAQYGTKVTVLDVNDTFMPREDEEIAQLIKQDLTTAGIDFKSDVKDIKLHETNEHVHISYNDHDVLTSDIVLLATGRQPNTKQLALENTDIQTNERGAIIVNEYLQTTVPNIWALGDVTGGLQFTYISLDDYRIIADQLFGKAQRTTKNRPIVPYTVFITPPLSVVGINESQAKQQGYDYKIFQLSVANIPKAHILGDTRGLFKVIIDKTTNYILGATLYGIESQELINLITLTMQANLPYTMLKNQIYTHPTMSEAFNDLFK